MMLMFAYIGIKCLLFDGHLHLPEGVISGQRVIIEHIHRHRVALLGGPVSPEEHLLVPHRLTAVLHSR